MPRAKNDSADDESLSKRSTRRDRAVAAVPETPNRPSDVSPPGMKLRSGRKKRRRSAEGNADEQDSRKKKHKTDDDDRSSGKDGSGEEDQVMEDSGEDNSVSEEGESMDEDDASQNDDDGGGGKMPATTQAQPNNGSNGRSQPPSAGMPASVRESSSVSSKRVSATRKLNTVASSSQQGDAKSVESTLSQPNRRPPTGRQSRAQSRAATDQRHSRKPTNRKPKQAVASATEGDAAVENGDAAARAEDHEESFLSKAAAYIRETAEKFVGPQPVVYDEMREIFGETASRFERFAPLLRYAAMWYFLVLTLMLIFSSFLINPFLSTAVDISNFALGSYQGLPGGRVELQEKDKKHTLEAWVKEYTTLRAKLVESKSGVSVDRGLLQSETLELHRQARTRLSRLEGYVRTVAPAFDKLKVLVEDNRGASAVADLRSALQDDKDLFLDFSMLREWNLPDSECAAETTAAILNRVEVRAGGVREAASRTATVAMQDVAFEAKIREWVNDRLRVDIPNHRDLLEEKRKVTDGGSGGAHVGSVRRVVEARIEVERADETGRIDYASILNGAEIIRSGERATSPSLPDQLPVVNRIAGLLSLRSYGHGPEAAITPNVELGQCWAFQKDIASEHSAYATLSIRLSLSAVVDTVSIEHLASATASASTAIRSFRVFGFDGPDANGKRYDLGVFEYTKNGHTRQHFSVATSVRGEPVPPLRSISVSIDSTWDAQYACLYRVRVLGKSRDAV